MEPLAQGLAPMHRDGLVHASIFVSIELGKSSHKHAHLVHHGLDRSPHLTCLATLDLEPMEKRQLIGTTTIIIVLFTILLLGGSTMPLIRLMDIEDAKARRRNKKDVNLSKTEKMVSAPWAREWDGGLVCTAAGKWGNETRFDDLSTYTHIYQLPASEGGWSPEAPCELFASLWPHGGKGTQPTFSVGSTGLSAAMSQPRPCVSCPRTSTMGASR